jgi:hypothetical protein
MGLGLSLCCSVCALFMALRVPELIILFYSRNGNRGIIIWTQKPCFCRGIVWMALDVLLVLRKSSPHRFLSNASSNSCIVQGYRILLNINHLTRSSLHEDTGDTISNSMQFTTRIHDARLSISYEMASLSSTTMQGDSVSVERGSER